MNDSNQLADCERLAAENGRMIATLANKIAELEAENERLQKREKEHRYNLVTMDQGEAM